MPTRCGTRLFTSRHNPTPTRTYKAAPRKDPENFCTSHSMTVWYYTLSPCFITTRMSRRGTTSQMCSRNPTVRASVCAAWRTTQLLHYATAMLALQTHCQAQYNSHERTIHWGWSGKSRSLDVPTYLAGPFQPSQERYDSSRHPLASYVSWGYRAHMCAGKVQRTIQQESFQQEQKRKQETWYWVYGQSPKKFCFKKHCNLCKKHGGGYTKNNTKDCHKYEKDGSEKANFHTANKSGF